MVGAAQRARRHRRLRALQLPHGHRHARLARLQRRERPPHRGATRPIVETGPGGGAMVYVPLAGVDHADCQNVYRQGHAAAGPRRQHDVQRQRHRPRLPEEARRRRAGWRVAVGFVENAARRRRRRRGADRDVGRRRARPTRSSPTRRPSSKRGASRRPPASRCAATTRRSCGARARRCCAWARCARPNTATRKNNGMILAQPAAGRVAHGLGARRRRTPSSRSRASGHFAEAKAALDFFLNARARSAQVRELRQQRRLSHLGRALLRQRRRGGRLLRTATPERRDRRLGPRAVGGARSTSRPRATRRGSTSAIARRHGLPGAHAAASPTPLEPNLETHGIVEADSSIWEVHDANKQHFAYTTMAAARGFCDMAAHREEGAARRRRHELPDARRSKVNDRASSALRRSAEARSAARSRADRRNKYYDGAVAEAFTWNLLADFDRRRPRRRRSTLLDKLKRRLAAASSATTTASARTTTTSGSSSTCASPTRSGAPAAAAEADGYLAHVVQKAAANFYLLPELYNDVRRRRRRSASTPASSRWSATAAARSS